MNKKITRPGASIKKAEYTLANRFSIERIAFFSDAVFAIAITILVLDIRLPTDVDASNAHELFRLLVDLWPKYLAYFISFWVIGISWISHHRKFLYIQKVDYPLLVLNLQMLMMIAFIPFPTAVMSERINFTSTTFYTIMMIITSLTGLILWLYASRNRRLIDPNTDRKRIWQEASVPLATITIFALSIGIGFLDVGLARISWILIFPVAFFLRRNTE